VLHEHHLSVTRTARYFTLGDGDDAMRELWIVCHGYGQLAASFVRHFEPLATEGRLIVAPEALNRFYLDAGSGRHGPASRVGATWMTREDRLAEIDDQVSYLDALHDALLEPTPAGMVQLRVLGFSQGVATVGRWLALGRARAAQLILWGAPLPHDLGAEALARITAIGDLVLVAGTTDVYFDATAAETEHARLRDQRASCRVVTFDGGHRLDRETLMRFAQTPVRVAGTE
jgi:predicted esterase